MHGSVAKWLLRCCRCAPCGCGLESAGAETEECGGRGGRDGTRALRVGLANQRVCGRHVSKYCAIQFPIDITWGLRFFSSLVPKNRWKNKVDVKIRQGLHTSRWNMFKYIEHKAGTLQEDNNHHLNSRKRTLQMCIFIRCSQEFQQHYFNTI